MTFMLFITLFTIGSLVASLLTEALKKAFDEARICYSSNLIALIMAIVVGVAGMMAAYVILNVPFDAIGIICIAFMALAIWVGSMIGYDKVKQLLEQLNG